MAPTVTGRKGHEVVLGRSTVFRARVQLGVVDDDRNRRDKLAEQGIQGVLGDSKDGLSTCGAKGKHCHPASIEFVGPIGAGNRADSGPGVRRELGSRSRRSGVWTSTPRGRGGASMTPALRGSRDLATQQGVVPGMIAFQATPLARAQQG